MKTKLTLSVSEATVRKAKRQAKRLNTSVSAMFAESVDRLDLRQERTEEILRRQPRLRKLVGSPVELVAFDERSAAILQKHG